VAAPATEPEPPSRFQVRRAEHGPRSGDELNRIVEGGNFGWPLLTEGTEYSGQPIDPPAELPGDLVEALYLVTDADPGQILRLSPAQ
jgi:glucose/arabinose dehydrogenase